MSLTTAIAQYVMTMEVIEDAMEEEQIWSWDVNLNFEFLLHSY
jgi:hypothetical protein